MGFVAEVEAAEHDVGGWADFDVFFFICEIVVEVGIDLHGDLLVKAHWDVDCADDCDHEKQC